MTDDAHDVIF